MPKPMPGHLITREQQAALAWLNEQVELGKLSRPVIEDATGLTQSNVWMILTGRRVVASKGVRALVEYAHKLQGRKPKPPEKDPFKQLRLVALEAGPRDRKAITEIVRILVQVYSSRRRHR